MKGTLFLIPTPINDDSLLHPEAKSILEKASANLERSLILVEEPKQSRRRWIRWGLPREVIDRFLYFNEHKGAREAQSLVDSIAAGKTAYLISDGGLPAFCDPGRELISLCHDRGIKVTSTTFCNSVALAYALSGFSSQDFRFSAFPPKKTEQRRPWFQKFLSEPSSNILMDTAYRLEKVLSELKELIRGDEVFFLAMDLGRSNEWTLRGTIPQILSQYDGSKRDFILVKGPNG